VLRFTCPYCSVNPSAREDRAGKKVVCPRCKGKIQLSGLSNPEPTNTETAGDPDLHLIDPPKALNGDLLQLKDEQPPTDDAVDDRQREEELRSSVLGESPPEHTGQRKLPWPIDILLYPLSGPGLIILGIVIVIPLSINLIGGLMGPFGSFILIPGFIVDSVIQLYFLWYVTECILDSGLGGVRAPDTIAQAPGVWDMLVRTCRTIACIAVALLPMMAYWLKVRTMDAAFWSLLALAAAVCPMALLSVTMYDSMGGLNPLVLISSVLRAFLSYLGLILVLGLLIFVVVKIKLALADDPILSFAFSTAEYYPMLIAAHLLGRFYWRNRERLDWVV
jgi:hypothetical protein